MEPIELERVDDELWHKIHLVHRAVFRITEIECQRYGVERRQVAPMFFLAALGGKATRAELMHHLFREPHTISELVGRMEKRGLVRRIQSPTRMNGVLIELTEKGWDICNKVSESRPTSEVFSRLTDEQKTQLSGLLSLVWDSTTAAAKTFGRVKP